MSHISAEFVLKK